jgi:hypothetical protein
MSKSGNITESETIRVTLSKQSVALLDELARKGIYGRNRADVAARFVDEALQKLVETPVLKIREHQRNKKR